MTALLEIKQRMKEFYAKDDIYIIPAVKFILAMAAFFTINSQIGFMEKITSPVIGGQVVDVQSTGRAIDQEELDFIYELKTGALLEASMMVGAVLAGASDEEVEAVEKIASDVGLAFQIRDDILDVTSTLETLGKPINSDDRNEKTTYVTIHGLEQASKDVEEISERAIEHLKALPYENEFLLELIKSLIYREK